MIPALRAGALDVAVSLCPEVTGELSYEPIRAEPVVVLLGATHPLAGGGPIRLGALAEEALVLFPRDIAPRLYDTLVGICRREDFEPQLRKESFHTGWELGVLADVPVVALAPQSVAHSLPAGVVALALSEPHERLETNVVWRTDDSSPTLAAFLESARRVFDRSSSAAVDAPLS